MLLSKNVAKEIDFIILKIVLAKKMFAFINDICFVIVVIKSKAIIQKCLKKEIKKKTYKIEQYFSFDLK